MSDHMVLGASITAILATEVVLALGDLRRALSRKQRLEAFRLICLAAGATPAPQIPDTTAMKQRDLGFRV